MSAIDHLLARGVPLMPRPLVRRFAAPYIAGETLAEAVEASRRLNAAKKRVTIDVLGEEIDALGEAVAIRDTYIAVLDALAQHRLDGDVSVKPTGLGLHIDRDACRDLIGAIAEHAAARGTTVEIDMEDSSTTTDILAVYHELRARGHENLGIVLQAMLRRTPGDIDALAGLRPRVRICKGIYVEPADLALQGFDEVRAAWVAALERLIEIGAFPAIATHDAYLIGQATAPRRRRAGLTADAYEFQMLLGVRPGLGDELVRAGHPLRVYVPFGDRWYEYSVRRLRENPGLARSGRPRHAGAPGRARLESADALHPRRQDRLPADSRGRHRPLGVVLRDGVRLEHPAQQRRGRGVRRHRRRRQRPVDHGPAAVQAEPGIVVYVMVDSVEETLAAIVAAGGEVVTPFTPQGPGEGFATFRDPAGNVLGLGQQP